jgi:D-glycero-D-manno-heptose 1,7-bisphosphate phosphatase
MTDTESLIRSAPRPGFFLDRDGVIIEEVHYLSDPAQVRLLPGAAEAIARLNVVGIPVVVATNQAGVAHGYFPEARVAEVHQRLDELLAARGALVNRYYYCPHHPAASIAQYRAECACRKPAAGMLLRAAAELDLDLPQSYLVGDRLSDIEAGIRAGCQVVLVLTGYGATEAQSLGAGEETTGGLSQFSSDENGTVPLPKAVRVAADLAEAVHQCIPVLSSLHRAA